MAKKAILVLEDGSATMIESMGLPVKMVTKKLSEGHPNVIDVIQDNSVSGVINTITGGRVPLKDGLDIRRAAAEKRIPCFTSLDTARVAIEALADSSQIFNVQPLREYLRKSEVSKDGNLFFSPLSTYFRNMTNWAKRS